jgi:hypothetical protein
MQKGQPSWSTMRRHGETAIEATSKKLITSYIYYHQTPRNKARFALIITTISAG